MKKVKFKALIILISLFMTVIGQIGDNSRVLGKEIHVDKSTGLNSPVLLSLTESSTSIYLDGVNGNDANDGSTKETAVKTFEKAKELVTSYTNITTIFVTGQVTIDGDISLEGSNAIVKRDESYNGYLFFINTSNVVTLSNITIDGNSELATNANKALIYCKGTLNITDGTVLQNNKIGSPNTATKCGGAINANGYSCVVNMTGGTIQFNTATYGGGILVYKGAKFNMSGGTIQNNQAVSGPTDWNDAGAGGGVCVYDGGTFNLSGGFIKSNNADEVGGGVSIGTIEVSLGNNYFNMTGGTIDSNTSGATGGGIFLQAAYGNRVAKATISAGSITNNRMNGTGYTNFLFGGGGIYVNGYKASGFKNAHLYITNAIITDNEAALQGGGYAACPISNTNIYLKDGCALYGNRADSAKDIFLYSAIQGWGAHGGNPNYYISNTMLGGVAYNWKYNDGTEVPLNKLRGTLMGENVSFSLYTDQTANSNTNALAKVYITGNYSATRGGGIGSNGDVTIGTSSELTELDVKKLWDDNNDEKGIRPETIEVELWRKSVGSSEETYIGYETVTADANGNWSLKFTNLVKTDANGNDYQYIVKERKVNGYVAEITADGNNGYLITNSYEPNVISIEGKKTWNDYDDISGIRPESITIRLLRNGEEVALKIVTEADNWIWCFEDQPKYDENYQLYKYTITEDSIKYYETTISGYDVTNSLKDKPKPVPPTGDNLNIKFMTTIMIISFISIIGLVFYQKKYRKTII